MPHEGVSWQQGGADIGMDADRIEIEEPARRIEPSLVASVGETVKQAKSAHRPSRVSIRRSARDPKKRIKL
jgi:hypothetical protein